MPGKCHAEGTSVGRLRQSTGCSSFKDMRKLQSAWISFLSMIALAGVFSFVVPLRVCAQQPVGVARIVVNNVSGTLPTAPERVVLSTGLDVFRNEVIDTATSSTALVVFQDNTQLAICPSTQVALRGALYDPNPTKSELIVFIPNGCTTLTSGLLLKTTFFNTPSAEIRTYGTIVTVTVSARGGTTVSVADGAANVTGAGRTITVSTGQSTLVLQGRPPTPPAPTPPAPPIVSEMNRLLMTASTQDFGTRAAARSPPVEAPTDARTRIFSPNVDGKIQSEIAGDATPAFGPCAGSTGTLGSRGTHGACGSRGTHGSAGSRGTH